MVELHEHQQAALEKLATGKILYGGVGSGKTIASLAWYIQNFSDKPLYVITTAKKRDSLEWEKDAANFSISTHFESPLAGKLVVDSWNNISKWQDVQGAVFIFDEQRLVGSGAWTKSFIKIARHNDWLLLSATPGDTWLDYIPVMVANGFYKNRTEFKREHVVYNTYSKFPKVDHYVNVGKLVRNRNELLVHMPYKKHTKRHIHTEWVDYNQDEEKLIWEKRWNVFENKPLKDVADLCRVARKSVNLESSRLSRLKDILTTHSKVIVFYNFNYELEMLRSWSTSLQPSVEIAEWNGQKHQGIPDSEEWLYLVQYTAGAEGWNCTKTDAMVFYSLNYSFKITEQAMGRIDRLNTPFTDLHYYFLRSKSKIDTMVWKSVVKKETFNEKKALGLVLK